MPVLEPKVECVFPSVQKLFEGGVVLSPLHKDQLLHCGMFGMIELDMFVECLAPAIEGSDLWIFFH